MEPRQITEFVPSYAKPPSQSSRAITPESLYSGIDISSASSQTGYKWSFASKASSADNAALQAARDEVGAATYKRPSRSGLPSGSAGGRVQGPTLPSQADLTFAREAADEHRAAERDYGRKRERKEVKERVEEMVGPKEAGREGMLENKRVQRESDRAFRERGDEGLEVDESTLMGGGDSFKERCVFLSMFASISIFLMPSIRGALLHLQYCPSGHGAQTI